MDCSYRSYQQVLNISVKPSPLSSPSTKKENCSRSKVTKTRKDESPIKRRTKTGCFTCRKRKKKCDEDKVNGKCQACTRNFLECCWPEYATSKESKMELKADVKSPTVRSTKCDISSLLSSPVNHEAPLSPEITIKSMPSKVKQDANPYPSPIQSPVSHQPASPSQEVSFMTLPPLRNINYKLQAKDSNVRGSREEVSTAREKVSPIKSKEESNTKFIITSFDSRKDLCDIKN
ncbi:hypothetical protein CANMA_002538 [Candida margitis]|uniref:uncharacterized protein n=1 Tax=Candida margitis TaxID=1775924 RepID=UPI002227BD5F|nr:uncharacterized protein CANMA_002538 [Candida margitis]KAI5968322.1 hypothetical protein CANMA_002538 [Candida margitis]